MGFALVHLAFWEARQELALRRYLRGERFADEDPTVNGALEEMMSLFRQDQAGRAAAETSKRVDAVVAELSAGQYADLCAAGFAYAVERWRHHEDHLAQIEAVLP